VKLQSATYVRKEIKPGWSILADHVPLGKRYKVDLDSIRKMKMLNTNTGEVIRLEVIWIVEPAPSGWLPLMAFKVDES